MRIHYRISQRRADIFSRSVYMHGRSQGGGKKGHLPPLEIQKYRGPHKDNLMRKNYKKKFKKLSEETELRAPPPHLVSEETDLRGGSYIVSEETDLRGPHIECEETHPRGPHIVSEEIDPRGAPI